MLRKLLVLVALLATAACGTPPKTAVDATRANARAAVLVAKAAYVLVGNGCLDVSTIAKNGTIATKCAAYLDPAYKLILDAAAAVDTTWSPVAACELVQAGSMIAQAVTDLGPVGTALAPYATDGALLARNLLGGYACPAAPPVTP